MNAEDFFEAKKFVGDDARLRVPATELFGRVCYPSNKQNNQNAAAASVSLQGLQSLHPPRALRFPL